MSRGTDQMFERRSAIIRNGKVLDFDYVPSRLVNRDLQLSKLETLFRPLAVDGRACSAFLTGSVGTGKTVTAKRFTEDMGVYLADHGRPIDTVYVNCRNVSEVGALIQLIHHYDPGYPERGFSAEEMARVLSQHLAGNSRALVVILDEVDILLKKGSTDLVYQLTRARTNQTASVSLIMISQEPIEFLLDEASVSTFRRTNTIAFNKYGKAALREIIDARVEEALVLGTYEDSSLDLIAEMASEFGDARMAIEILDRAANIAEGEDGGELTPEHIRAAKAMIYSSMSETKIRSLKLQPMLILLATARAMKTHVDVPAAAVEKTYHIVCEEYGVKANQHTQFWTNLQNLNKEGFIRMNVVSGSSGRVSMVSLLDIPSKVLAKKLESILEGEDDYDEM